MRNVLILCFFLFCGAVQAQKMKTTANADSSFFFTRDPKLDELIAKQKRSNLEKQSMPGYRVQIYFGGNRQKAAETKVEFNTMFPDLPAYISYQAPNFKVRVGDYSSRFEAQKLRRQLQAKFPTTFVVPDDIRLPPVK